MSDSDVVPSSLGGPGPPRRWVARVEALQSLLAIRERELLDLKGPCSTAHCRLHFAHNGPCDFRKV